MKSKKSKIITFSILIVAVICSVIFAVGATDDTSKEYWKLVPMEIADYRKETGYTAPDYDDTGKWIFAGWFDEEGNAVSKDTKSGTYNAKFVPADILGLKAQVNIELSDDDTTNDDTQKYTIDGEEVEKGAGAIRFVTSVDSLDYSKVGFKITRGTNPEEDRANNKVYQQLYATGEAADGSIKTDQFKPKELFNADASTYFKTWTYTKVPSAAYDMDIQVTPYWVTLDGTTVKGTTSVKCVNMGRQWKYIFVDDTATSNDAHTGTRGCPYATLNDALAHIEKYGKAEGGQVIVLNNMTVASWDAHGLDVTIKGDTATSTVSATADLCMGDGATFENMKLALPETVYAGGNRLKIAESVTVSNATENQVTIYGGGNGVEVDNTHVTLLTGTYKAVYGGGNAANVTGNTNVYIGGNVNAGIDYTEHESTKSYSLYGGGLNGNIDGSTKLTVEGNALFTHIFGGGKGAGTVVNGQSEVYFKGNAKAMSMYGGSQFGKNNASTLVKMDGNTWVEQVFGGCQANVVNGNTNVQILGGTVNRRVYGGCYNNFNESSKTWDTSCGVTGKTNVTIGKDADLAFDYKKTVLFVSKKSDNSLYATSRYSAPFENEVGIFLFSDYEENDVRGGKIGCVDEWGYANYFSQVPYHYLVKTSGDGNVSVSDDGSVLCINPNDGMEAIVTIFTGESGVETYYTTEDSTYQLPDITSTTEQHVVEIKFSTKSDNKDVSGYKAKIGNAYYATLEAAVNSVNTTDATTITVLDDIDVTSTITVPAGSNVTIKDDGTARSLNRGSSLTTGAMIQLGSKTTLTLESSGDINNCKLILDGKNVTPTSGNNTPLIQLPKDANATLNINAGVKLQDNKSGNDSGAVHVDGNGGTVHVDGAYFVNNGAVRYGGALRFWSGEGHTVENAKFENNTAAIGGAIWANDNVKCTITDTTFVGNSSTDTSTYKKGGGAICVGANTEFTITGSKFDSNSATLDGGAIFVSDSANTEFTITDCKFIGNTATRTGGAIRNGGKLTLTGTSENAIFSGNIAKEGGAVAVAADKTLTLKGYKFDNNTAADDTTNPTKGDGGAIWLNKASATVTDTTFTGNSAVNGGAVYMKQSSTLTLAATTGSQTAKFVSNTATNGSAIYATASALKGSGYTFAPDYSQSVVVEVTTLQQMTDAVNAISNALGIIRLKGDIDVTNTITIPAGSNVTIEDDGTARSLNKTDGLAAKAMIKLDTGATLTLRSTGEIKEETIDESVVENGCNLTLDGKNIATSGTSPLILLENNKNATVNINKGVKLQNNISQAYGGAVRVQANGGTVNIDGAYFVNNQATVSGRGGALGLHNNTSSTIENAVFRGNQAVRTSSDGMGGAIWTSDAVSCSITGTTFAKNKACGNTQNNGGAIYAGTNTLFAITDSEFNSNSATQDGGAIFVSDSAGTEFTITDCKFIGNTATRTGGAIRNGGKLTLIGASENAIFSENVGKEGGAVAIAAGYTLALNGYKFDNNTATNATTSPTSGDGGAIWLNKASATVTDATFTNNKAVRGGAIFMKGNGGTYTFALEATPGSQTAKFDNNTLIGTNVNGSAIYVLDDATYTLLGSGYTFNNPAYSEPEVVYVPTTTTNKYIEAIYTVSTLDGLNEALYTISSATDKAGIIRLTEDIDVSNTITIPAGCNVTIEDDGYGTARSLNRASTLTATAPVIKLDTGATLTLASSGDIDNCKLILDGQNVTTTGNSPLIQLPSSANATLNINAGVKLRNNKSAGDSGVVHVDGNGGIVHVDGAYFVNNVAGNRGGALRMWSGEGHTVENAKFENNKATTGGAIFTGTAKVTCTIENTEFVNNTATNGGAIYLNDNAEAECIITDCKFTNNTATSGGGAIMARPNVVLSLTGTSDNAIFSGNKADEGGAVGINAATLTLTGYTFDKNTTEGVKCEGGAVWLYKSSATITDTTFIGNSAVNGGAVFMKTSSTLTLVATTDSQKAKFVNNTVTTGKGSAIYLNASTLNGSGYTFTPAYSESVVAEGGATNSYENEE